MGDFRKIRVIHSGTFLVMEVKNPRTGENQIVYTTNSIDEDKDSYTWEELKPVWWWLQCLEITRMQFYKQWLQSKP